MVYIGILGTAHTLCAAELEALLQLYRFKSTTLSINGSVVIFETDKTLPPDFLAQSGGLVKLAAFVCYLPSLKTEEIVEKIIQDLPDQADVFGISSYLMQTVDINRMVKDIKKQRAQKGLASRYVVGKEAELSSVVVKKQQVSEYILLEAFGKIVLGKTVAVQDSDEWARRDFGRPAADPHSGMLPPKIARMMVNVARSHLPNSGERTLLDPFCGMGTVISEAQLGGFKTIGSDISDLATAGARKNIEWLHTTYPNQKFLDVQFLTADVTHLDSQIPKTSIDGIVTEPFLGAPFEKRGNMFLQKGKPVTLVGVENTVKGLEKLYLGAFKVWASLLKSRGIVVIALPEIYVMGRVFGVKKLIDRCEKLGYTLHAGPYLYKRPNAVVARAIYIFHKN